jgi:hypothetical protein
MQTDETPIETYILIDTNDNEIIREVKMTKHEFLNKNYAYGLNHSKLKYIKKTKVPTIISYENFMKEISNYE